MEVALREEGAFDIGCVETGWSEMRKEYYCIIAYLLNKAGTIDDYRFEITYLLNRLKLILHVQISNRKLEEKIL